MALESREGTDPFQNWNLYRNGLSETRDTLASRDFKLPVVRPDGERRHTSSEARHPELSPVMNKLGKKKREPSKLCLVCGGRALSNNYGATSCESCKAFFRRNAFKNPFGRCDGTCDVTEESRSICKKCRLNKCVMMGMRKELIIVTPKETVTSNSDISSSSQQECKPSPPEGSHQIAELVSPEDLEGLPESIYSRLLELVEAFSASFDATVDASALPTAPDNTQVTNLAVMSIKRLVQMAKKLSCFRSLQTEDQISLLKASVIEILLMRSVTNFSASSHGWSVMKSNGELQHISADRFASEASGQCQGFFPVYENFIKHFAMELRNDGIILMIMMVLSLFSSDRAQLQNRQIIEAIQEQYAECLHTYIHHRYPKNPLLFARLLQKLADIRQLNDTHTQLLLQTRVKDLQPLVVEILDL